MRVLATFTLICSLAVPAVAEEATPVDAGADSQPTEESESPVLQRRPAIGLDSLLRPREFDAPGPTPDGAQRGGKSRAEWQDQVVGLRAEVTELEERIQSSQERFREVSGTGMVYSPAAAGTTDGPIPAGTDPEVLKLRAQLRRDRQSLDAVRQRLREVEIEASLAGVPDEWISP